MVCRQGNFTFSLNMKAFSAQAGGNSFHSGIFPLSKCWANRKTCNYSYHLPDKKPIRDIIGNSVAAMYLYMQLRTEPCYVWNTGDEEQVEDMSLLDNTLHLDTPSTTTNKGAASLGLTYRIVPFTTVNWSTVKTTVGHKHEIFIRLIQLIDAHYTEVRGAGFMHRNSAVTQIPLCTIQVRLRIHGARELIFKSIIRKSISLLKNTQQKHPRKSPISNPPNASYLVHSSRNKPHVSSTVPQKKRTMPSTG